MKTKIPHCRNSSNLQSEHRRSRAKIDTHIHDSHFPRLGQEFL